MLLWVDGPDLGNDPWVHLGLVGPFLLGGHHCCLGGMDARAAALGGRSHGCLSGEHHRAGGGCILWPFGRQ
jgi:hypothetical protein